MYVEGVIFFLRGPVFRVLPWYLLPAGRFAMPRRLGQKAFPSTREWIATVCSPGGGLAAKMRTAKGLLRCLARGSDRGLDPLGLLRGFHSARWLAQEPLQDSLRAGQPLVKNCARWSPTVAGCP